MQTVNILMVIAIVTGPILAIQVQKYIERIRDSRIRKINIFKVLMATRGNRISITHVEALNRIDLEFSNKKKYRKVTDSWKEYFNQLYEKYDENDFSVWDNKKDELFVSLLYEMGSSLKFDFNKALIKRNIYSPQGHQDYEETNKTIRDGILKIIKGESKFPIKAYHALDEETLKKQLELTELSIKYFKMELEKKK